MFFNKSIPEGLGKRVFINYIFEFNCTAALLNLGRPDPKEEGGKNVPACPAYSHKTVSVNNLTVIFTLTTQQRSKTP
jgi:hypothetical protein